MTMSKMTLVAEPNQHELHTSRSFNARRELVFKVFTDPALVPQWWGPRNSTTLVDAMDVRKGGIWRYIQRDPDGSEYAFNGVYHEISAPERIIYTFEFEGMPGHVLLETISFEERDGKTIVTDSSVFQTVADRDGMIQSGMESGAADTWDRLEEILNTM